MNQLYTEIVENDPSWNDIYPRPQMKRKGWQALNGTWQADNGDTCVVPFCPESLLSGLRNPPEPGKRMRCSRSFCVPEAWRGQRVLVHFGAVSRRCTVTVNGILSASHEQAYLPFSIDITDALREGENKLCVEIVNDLSPRYPWGKQSRKRGGMWYTPVSGIWQTVWIEPVPEKYIRGLTIETDANGADILAEGADDGLILFEGSEIQLKQGRARLEVPDPILWSPENPHLYRFEIRSGEDRVKSYFALRTLSIEERNGTPRLCLNGEPYFFHGLLDQGYWSDGLYTPASPDAYEKDILTMKSLGFNTLRKHIKIEPEQFYYDCDRLGMIVFQDMVNNGEYRYLRDTVLPTFGMTELRDSRLNRDGESRRIFLESMKETVMLLKNHPCICLWTIFNEGWGQFCADDAYLQLKAMDGSRWVDSTSGWFRQNRSDVESLHIYFKKLRLRKNPAHGRPQLLSEFGGYSYKIPDHSFNLQKTYGYRKYAGREDYVRGIRMLYDEVLDLAEKGLCGSVYTQVSDVEDETNGLFSYDREVLKIEPQELLPWAEKLQKAVQRQKKETS